MFGGSILVFGLLVTWLTPIWLVSVGVAVGTVVLGLLYAIAYLVAPRLAEMAVASVREGILLPIFYLALFLTAFAAVGVFLVPEIPYPALAASASRLMSVGPSDYEIVDPAGDARGRTERLRFSAGRVGVVHGPQRPAADVVDQRQLRAGPNAGHASGFPTPPPRGISPSLRNGRNRRGNGPPPTP